MDSNTAGILNNQSGGKVVLLYRVLSHPTERQAFENSFRNQNVQCGWVKSFEIFTQNFLLLVRKLDYFSIKQTSVLLNEKFRFKT